MKKPLLGIFLLALALRIAWVLTLDPSLPWDDEREFATVARHLAAGDGFISTSFRANPVLPAYLGAVFRVFGLRADRRLVILYALLGSIITAYGFLNACTRFRLPLDPFLIILAALALTRLWDSLAAGVANGTAWRACSDQR